MLYSCNKLFQHVCLFYFVTPEHATLLDKSSSQKRFVPVKKIKNTYMNCPDNPQLEKSLPE